MKLESDFRPVVGRVSGSARSARVAKGRLARSVPQRVVVIGGCARSGTTLLATILSAHPKIHLISAAGQDRETGALCRDLMRDDEPLEAIHRQLLELPRRITCWCEKTPANVHFAASTLEYFGNRVRFINLVRDGRDVVCSVHPSAPDRFWVAPGRWVHDVEAGVRLEGDERFLTLRYEDLVGDHVAALERLCRFIGEPFDDALLDYPRTARVQRSGAWFGDAVAVHSSSVGRWRDLRNEGAVSRLLAEPGALALLRRYRYLT